MNREAIRERYLQDTFPKRLMALAANFGRISSFSRRGKNIALIKGLIEESEYFIEWTALEAPFPLQAELIELQIQLALRLRKIDNASELDSLALEAQSWAEKLLEIVA